MRARVLALALLLPLPASAAAPQAARPAPRRPAPPPAVLPPAPARRAPADAAELRRLRADLGGRVVARARAGAAKAKAEHRGAALRAELKALAGALRREQAQLRLDRERALDGLASAAKGSRERELWWTAVQADTVMLEDYARALSELDAALSAPARRSPAAGSSPRAG